MRLLEFYAVTEDDSKTGTFVGAKLSPDTEKDILDWYDRVGMENPEPREDLHITLIGDKKREFPWDCQEYPPLEIDPSTFSLEEFGDEEDKALVLRFESPELEERHWWGRETHNIDWKFPVYKPHITLGYDTGLNPEDLPMPDFPLIITGEFTTPWESTEDRITECMLVELKKVVNIEES